MSMKKMSLSAGMAYDWMVITFLSRDTIDKFFQVVLSRIGLLHLYSSFTAFVIFFPVLIFSILSFSRMKACLPFLILYISLYLVFQINLSIHPDYLQYYTREIYGAYTVFFSFSTGAIWGFLVFTLAPKAKHILADIHIAAILLLIYCLFIFYKASKAGYWEEFDDRGVLIKIDYSLVFGYKTIFCCIVFIFFFFEKRNVLDLVGAILSFFMDIKAGSRGSLICLGMFVVLYMLVKARRMKTIHKITISVAFLGLYVFISKYFSKISSFVLSLLKKLNINSRTVEMLLNGNIASDNGRARISELSWDGIAKQGFFGMGPFGCRTIIAPYYNYGYPHNIFLEFVLDYGWFFGTLALTVLMIMIIRTLMKKNKIQTSVLIILLSMCMKLLISGSYWSEPLFWGLVGWAYICKSQKNRNDIFQLIGI